MPTGDNKLVFKYFPIRGKAEPVRLMMEDLMLKYDDIQVGPEWSMSEKQIGMENGRYPFGQLPQLVVNDAMNITHTSVQKYPQRQVHCFQCRDAIMRHLARSKNVYGHSENDYIRCDIVASACEDWRLAYAKLVYHPQFLQLKTQYIAEVAPMWLGQVERFLLRNSSKNYMVGDSATWVDYIVVELISVHLNLDHKCLEDFTTLQTYHRRFLDRPNIKKYLSSGKRPERVNGKGAMWDCWTLSERAELSFVDRPAEVPWY